MEVAARLGIGVGLLVTTAEFAKGTALIAQEADYEGFDIACQNGLLELGLPAEAELPVERAGLRSLCRVYSRQLVVPRADQRAAEEYGHSLRVEFHLVLERQA